MIIIYNYNIYIYYIDNSYIYNYYYVRKGLVYSTIPDIIKFTYYHCTSIDYSVLCE